MSRFKKNLIFLIVYILLVSSAIQFAYTTSNFPRFNAYFFPVITVMMILTIILPLFEKWAALPAFGIWGIAYISIWLALGGELNGEQFTMLLVELTFLALGIILVRETTLSFKDLESTIDKLIFSSYASRALVLEDALEEIQTELSRSRRYHRPLALVVITPELDLHKAEFQGAPRAVQKHLASKYILAQIAEIIEKEARRTDIIIKQNKPDRFIVLCPETQSSNTNTLIRRVVEKTREQVGVQVGFGVASFPEEALTFEELLQKAEAKLVTPGAFTLNEKQAPVKTK